MQKFVRLLCGSVLLFSDRAAFAQATLEPQPLSLADTFRLTRERNPDLLAARAGLEAAAAQQQIAAEFSNPTLTWTTAKIPSDGTRADTGNGNGLFDRAYDSTISVGQLVEVGGKRRGRRLSGAEGVSAARAHLADANRLAIAGSLKAYVAAVVARTNADLARETSKSFARTARLAAEREEAGDISPSERAQVEIAAGRFEADAALADLASRNAVHALEAALNMPATAEVRKLTDDLSTLMAATAHLTVSSEIEDAHIASMRPDLQALEAAVRKAGADLALQKAFRIPDPTLLAQYERQPPDQRNTFGIGVSIPLPVANRNAGAIRAAGVALASARRDLELGRQRVNAELIANRAALVAASSRTSQYLDSLLPKAEKVRVTVEYAYSQGSASLLELLEAERNANEIHLAASSARGDLITSRADFAAARMLPIEKDSK